MKKYHKIKGLYKFINKHKKFIRGSYSMPEFEVLKDIDWVWTEKVDGTNLRIIWDGYNLTYAGRKDTSEFSDDQKDFIKNNIITKDLEQLIEQMFGEKQVIIFGELYGKNIQKVGFLYSSDYKFIVFDIIVGEGNTYLERTSTRDIVYKLGLTMVPTVHVGNIESAIDYVRRNLFSTISPDTPLEGIVGIPIIDLYARNGERIIVKIKLKDLQKTIDIVE